LALFDPKKPSLFSSSGKGERDVFFQRIFCAAPRCYFDLVIARFLASSETPFAERKKIMVSGVRSQDPWVATPVREQVCSSTKKISFISPKYQLFRVTTSGKLLQNSFACKTRVSTALSDVWIEAGGENLTFPEQDCTSASHG
jgi:hypothetical protein